MSPCEPLHTAIPFRKGENLKGETVSPRIAGILVYGLTLTPLAACHHGASVAERSSPAQPPARLEELVGRFPGVDVVSTRAGGFLIRIRGVNSFVSSTEPLYVIDGSPVDVDPRRGLDWLKPADIQRIDVLKYPPEITIYGPRGANGVILITTRKGSR